MQMDKNFDLDNVYKMRENWSKVWKKVFKKKSIVYFDLLNIRSEKV